MFTHLLTCPGPIRGPHSKIYQLFTIISISKVLNFFIFFLNWYNNGAQIETVNKRCDRKSPEIDERFVDDFAITVPDARRITEVLQLTLCTNLHLWRWFNQIITTSTGQLVKCGRRAKTETRNSECLDKWKIKLQPTTRKVSNSVKKICHQPLAEPLKYRKWHIKWP